MRVGPLIRTWVRHLARGFDNSHVDPLIRTGTRWHARGRRPGAYLGVGVRVAGLTRMFSGSCASDTPGQAPLRPQRRPPRPRHPVVGVRYRGGLRRGRRRPETRPHRLQAWGIALYGDPCVTCLPVTSPPSGGNCASRGPLRDLLADDCAVKWGNCTIRGATRRRHAEGRLLMVQNPHHYPRCHAPSLVQDCPAGRR